ncbi:uncharacterized protein LOC108740097 [Agrilus planipennis]|uniref:Uncharacterized protein LOC108740097 n=1 Tax=Agrilus planipennis TaxID=224129 RepID=A0A7F5R2X8_AGRPL|nr:uncharacterized protein LOC108740097 [Agrilus planipennis]
MSFYSIITFVFSICLVAIAFGDSVQNGTPELANSPVAETRAETNNIRDCINPSATKSIVYTKTVTEPRRFLSYARKTVTYPSEGIGSQAITCIVVTDRAGTGGYASITNGGIGSTYVEISLRSAWNRELNFNIQLYVDE